MSNAPIAFLLSRDEKCVNGALLGRLYRQDRKPFVVGDARFENLRTIERPWLNNERNVSCIPADEYQLQRRTTGGFYARYKQRWNHEFSIEVAGVEGRSAILMHVANYVSDLQGCIGLGTYSSYGDAAVYGSKKAYKAFYDILASVPIPHKLPTLAIVDSYGPCTAQ